MDGFDPDEYAAQLDDAETRAEADVVFAGIEALPAPHLKAVLDLITDNTLHDLQTGMLSQGQLVNAQLTIKLADDVARRPGGAEFLKKLEAENEAPSERLVLVQAAINLNRLQGEAAHPVIRTLAAEAENMDNAELATMNGMFRLAVRTAEKLNLLAPVPQPQTDPVTETPKPAPKKPPSRNFDL